MSSIVPAYVESKTGHLNCIIDCDSIVYKCGWVGVERDEDGNPLPSPLAHSLSNLKTTVEGILARFPHRNWERIYLTPSGGFRYSVAKSKPYKGSRKSKKPQWFHEMREYLVKHYGAIIVDEDKPENERREADDLCSSDQWAHPDKSTCVCSIDKDLLMVPGWNYNFNKDQFQCRTLVEADLWFYYQLMVGDGVDNIAGLKGIGPKKAEQLIEACSRKRNRVRKAVFDLYRKEFSSKWEDALDETATLLFLEREPGKTWREYFWQ